MAATSASSPAGPLSKGVQKALAHVPGVPVGVHVVAGSYERLLFGLELLRDDQERRGGGCVRSAWWLHDTAGYGLKPLFIYAPHTGCIKTLAAGERYLASGSTDEHIRLYDVQKRIELGSLLQHQGSITALGFYQQTHLVSASEDGTLAIFRTSDWECLKVLKGHKGAVLSLAVHPSGKLALSTGADRTLRLWNLVSGRLAFSTKLARAAESVRWSSSGNSYAITLNNVVQVHDSKMSEVLFTLQRRGRVHQTLFYQDHVVLLAEESGAITAFSVPAGNELFSFTGHTNRCGRSEPLPDAENRVKAIGSVMVPSSNETLLCSVSSDGYIRVWALSRSVDVSEAQACLASYHADVRLTAVDAYAPSSARRSGEKRLAAAVSSTESKDDVSSATPPRSTADATHTKELGTDVGGPAPVSAKAYKKAALKANAPASITKAAAVTDARKEERALPDRKRRKH